MESLCLVEAELPVMQLKSGQWNLRAASAQCLQLDWGGAG